MGDAIGLSVPRTRRALVWGLGVALSALLVAVAPARAGATPLESGALTQSSPLGCIGEVEAPVASCGATVPYGLNFAYQIVVSPDDQNAYSVAVNGALIEYSRNQANGELTAIGCFSSRPGTEPCGPEHDEMGVEAIGGPSAVAVSPDGKSVYVVGQAHNTIVELEREPGGLLKKIGCITQEAASGEGCTPSAKGLDVPYGVTVSPEGENVYVTGFGEEAVAEFKRNTETGILSQLEPPNQCVGTTSSPCEIKANGLKEDIGIVSSPDGRNVYVAAGAKGAEGDVAALARGSEGALEPLGSGEECISEKFVPECKEGKYIKGIEDLAISPDGKNVYGSSYQTNAVIELQRSGTGSLEEIPGNACVSTEARSECQTVVGIGGAVGLAISPDGKDLYATSQNEDSVAAFERDPETGVLSQLATYPCVTEQPSGCGAAEFNELIGLAYPRRVTVSPDGTNVYVASQSAHALVELARTVTPRVSSVSLDHGTLTGEGVVRVKGSGFSEDAKGVKVSFGGKPSPEAVIVSASTIMAKSPTVVKEESVVVKVENGAGASADVPTDEFTYTNKPVVAGITPTVGTEAGGTSVTITGSEFGPESTVEFGGVPAASVTVDSAETINATSPPGRGTVDVTVKTAKGASQPGGDDKFTYANGWPNKPRGLDLAGYCGNHGFTGVVLEKEEVEGPGFAYENWACVEADGAEVLIAESGPAPSFESACVEGYGSEYYVYPENPNSAYAGGCYTVVIPPGPPTVNSITPNSGATAGGTSVTIKGTGFVAPETVTIGGVATEVHVVSEEEITANTPPGGAGSYEVVVSGVNGTSTGGPDFIYSAPLVSPPAPLVSPLTYSELETPVSSLPITVSVPAPQLAKTGDLAPVSGTVSVKVPGTSKFVPLATLEQVPFGSVIEATQGHVSVTVALPNGKTETGEFFSGEFILRQGPNGVLIAELAGGNFSVCPTARERAHKAGVAAPGDPRALTAAASGSHVVRKLWANAHGKFETKGNYAAGAVQGTEWLTEDLCDGTLIKVTRDKVAVTNLVNHRKVEVKTGHHYLAKAPR